MVEGGQVDIHFATSRSPSATRRRGHRPTAITAFVTDACQPISVWVPIISTRGNSYRLKDKLKSQVGDLGDP